MTNDNPFTLKTALERAGWPAREFRSHTAALLFAVDYLEQQQANGVSRASLHKEFESLGFSCNFNTFVVALKRAKAKARTNRGGQVHPAQITSEAPVQAVDTIGKGGSTETDKSTTHERAVKPLKGELVGFVSSEKSNSEKLRQELI